MNNTNKAQDIQKYKQDFEENSLIINKFKPFILKRSDKLNYILAEGKISKDNNYYENIIGYYSSIYNLLIALFKKKYNKYPRKEAFINYLYYTPEYGTKKVVNSVIKAFEDEVKLSKRKGYIFFNTYVKKTEAEKLFKQFKEEK